MNRIAILLFTFVVYVFFILNIEPAYVTWSQSNFLNTNFDKVIGYYSIVLASSVINLVLYFSHLTFRVPNYYEKEGLYVGIGVGVFHYFTLVSMHNSPTLYTSMFVGELLFVMGCIVFFEFERVKSRKGCYDKGASS